MTVGDVAEILEAWAPRWIAWEQDNVGLQVGDRQQAVQTVLVALELNDAVLNEARERQAELIVTHHPLLFRPTASVTADHDTGRHILELARARISLYAAHTNLDFTRDGVSYTLAERLGLREIQFLVQLPNLLSKIVVFVPESHVEQIREAMAAQGAGKIGEYASCSFQLAGTGTFRGSERSKPYAGTPGVLERVQEIRLEMILPRARTTAVVEALRRHHPYEEVAFDVYDLRNETGDYGTGAVGNLSAPESLRDFLDRVKAAVSSPAVRYTGDPDRPVHRVAVCGGSGSDLLEHAVSARADALVTADVRYHAFHTASGRIALVDAGHYETEQVVLEKIAARLEHDARARSETVRVLVTQQKTNPVHIR